MDALNSFLVTDPKQLNFRIKTSLSRWEFFALSFSAGMLLAFIFLNSKGYWEFHDFNVYIFAVRGDFSNYFYPYYLLPLLSLFSKIPHPAALFLWGILNIAGIFFAVRLFGGSLPLTLLSYQMLYSLGYGQVVGIMIGGAALFWWAI